MATHPSISAWETPRPEEPGRLASTGSQRAGHGWETEQARVACTHTSNTQNQTWTVTESPVLASSLWLSPKALHAYVREITLTTSRQLSILNQTAQEQHIQETVTGPDNLEWRQKCWMMKSYETRSTAAKVNKKAIVRLQIKQPQYVWTEIQCGTKMKILFHALSPRHDDPDLSPLALWRIQRRTNQPTCWKMRD